MSATKDYYSALSERLGFGGEVSDEMISRLERGDLKDTLLVINVTTGEQHEFPARFQFGSPFADQIDAVCDATGRPFPAVVEAMRAGETFRDGDTLRVMVIGKSE